MKVYWSAILAVLLVCGINVTAQSNQKSKQGQQSKTNTSKHDTTTLKELPPEQVVIEIPDTSAAPADALTASIKKLLEITGAMNLGAQFGKQLSNATRDNSLPNEFYERMYNELEHGESRRSYENMMIRVYRKYYVLEDINQMIAFYETPVGKKYVSLMPVVMEVATSEGMKFGRWLGMKIYNDLVKEGIIR
ncbi:MAG: DUF2059 domain-containing protein [Flavisolibacter sp.]|jgi:hypothetical protein